MVGYPRVIGRGGQYYPGTGMYQHPYDAYNVHGGYVVGADGQPMMMAPMLQAVPVQAPAAPQIQSPPWRPMMAPGSPPLGEGHVPMPLTPETFNGTWGGAAGAPAGTVITFSARPQKPFKSTRVLVNATKSGATAIGRLQGQSFVGTDLQQAELGFVDLESLGAGGSFDTWISFKQAEPGVWIRIQATLSAFPTAPDFEAYNITALGHYLH